MTYISYTANQPKQYRDMNFCSYRPALIGMLVLSQSCIVGNMLVPELSGCYWNMLVLKAVVVLGTCLFLSCLVVIGNMFVPEQSGHYLEHACS